MRGLMRVLGGVVLACVLACDDRREAAAPASDGAAGVDQATVDRLRALGYVDVARGQDPDAPVGVVTHDPARVAPGLTYYTDARGCRAHLMTLDGTEVASWSHTPCHHWANTVLRPDGTVLAVHAASPATIAQSLLHLDPDGAVLWERQMAAHHDVEVGPRGTIATLVSHHAVIPRFHATVPVREDLIVLLDGDGRVVDEARLLDLLESAPELMRVEPVPPRRRKGAIEIDLFHSNSLEWMAHRRVASPDPLYAAGNLLVCIRNQDTLAIIDWERRTLVWAWGRGELLSPHDATLLASGNILVFDNGVGRGWSRVLEVDPRTREIVWEYHAPERERFYSETRGAVQRLANGNTLITSSEQATIFEVTPDGQEVWRYRSPPLPGTTQAAVIVRARRVEPAGAPQRFRRSD